MAINKDLIVEQLGTLLDQAVRSSVAAGAQYAPGEDINLDHKREWQKVALNLLQLVEVMVKEQQKLDHVDAENPAQAG